MNHYLFQVTASLKEAKKELKALGFQDIYTIEDVSSHHLIGGWYPGLLPSLKYCTLLDSTIDWQSQWESFAPNFKDGLSCISLRTFKEDTPDLLLTAGAGFGDLSHTTTRIMLHLLGPRVPHKTVVDIGCGSGILTLAAALLGAKNAYGIDIDKDALLHCKKNLELNHLEERVSFSTHLDESMALNPPILVLMNMISTEQIQAWSAQKKLHNQSFEIITSGILATQRSEYLKLTESWNWNLLEEQEEEGWLGLIFSQSP